MLWLLGYRLEVDLSLQELCYCYISITTLYLCNSGKLELAPEKFWIDRHANRNSVTPRARCWLRFPYFREREFPEEVCLRLPIGPYLI